MDCKRWCEWMRRCVLFSCREMIRYISFQSNQAIGIIRRHVLLVILVLASKRGRNSEYCGELAEISL